MARSKDVFEADEGLFLLSAVIHVFGSFVRVEIAQRRGSRRGVVLYCICGVFRHCVGS